MSWLPTDSGEFNRFEIWLRGEMNSIDENDAELIGDFVLELLKNAPPEEEKAEQFLFEQLEEIIGEDTLQLVHNVLFALSPDGSHIWLRSDQDSKGPSTMSSDTQIEDFSKSAGNIALPNRDIPTQRYKLDSSHAANPVATGLLNFPPPNPSNLTQPLLGTYPMFPLLDSSGMTHPQVPAFTLFPPLASSLTNPIIAPPFPYGGVYDTTAPVSTPGRPISKARKAKPWDHIGVDVEEARKKIDADQKAFEERQRKSKEQEDQRLAIEAQIKNIEEERAKLLEALRTKASPQPQAKKRGNQKQALKDQIAKIEVERAKVLEALKEKGVLVPQTQTNDTQKQILEQQIRKIEEERTKLLDALKMKGASTPESQPDGNQKQTLEQQIRKIEQEHSKLLDVLRAKGALPPQESQKDIAKSERIAALRRQLAEKQAEARALGLIDEEGNDIPAPSPAYKGRGGSSYRGGYVARSRSYHPYRGPYRGFYGAHRGGYRGRGN